MTKSVGAAPESAHLVHKQRAEGERVCLPVKRWVRTCASTRAHCGERPAVPGGANAAPRRGTTARVCGSSAQRFERLV